MKIYKKNLQKMKARSRLKAMSTRSFERLAKQLKAGEVYRREDLLACSKAVDRDLAVLVKEGTLEKVGAGLYYKPQVSRFGNLPAEDAKLVQAFLRDDDFLLFSWNDYNSLGLGLTQLYNRSVVYNYKRHGVFTLGGKEFDFRRPARGFPKKLTPEFLLVDLLNNLKELTEDSDMVKLKVKEKLNRSLMLGAKDRAKKYGKVATKKFFSGLH